MLYHIFFLLLSGIGATNRTGREDQWPFVFVIFRYIFYLTYKRLHPQSSLILAGVISKSCA